MATTSLWVRSGLPLVVTAQGVCGVCPKCGGHIPLVASDDIDPCPQCGTLLRITIHTRPPWRHPGKNGAPGPEEAS